MSKCGFHSRDYTCDKERGHRSWHVSGHIIFCPPGWERHEPGGFAERVWRAWYWGPRG